MNITTLSEELRELARTPKKSKASQLFEILDDIEFAFAAGVTHAVVVQKLAQNGLQFTLPSFENTLHRVRQRKKRKPALVNKSVIHKVVQAEVMQTNLEKTSSSNGFAYESQPNKNDLI